MPRCFDDDFVGPHSIHLIINSFPFTVQLSLYSEGGELVGDDPKGPTGRIGWGSIFSKCKDFGWGSIFVAFAEGTEPACRSPLLCCKIRGPSTSLCGNNDPSSMDGIFSQFRHSRFSPKEVPT
jgi:hypothetical protein